MSGQFLIRRRQLLKASAAGAGFLAMGGAGLLSAAPVAQRLLGGAAAAALYIEVFPTSPVILNPFSDTADGQLPIPTAARPVPSDPFAAAAYWKSRGLPVPAPVKGGLQDANGAVHQLGPSDVPGTVAAPLIYHVRLQVGTHRFTNSQVLPIDSLGQPTKSFDANGNTYAPGVVRTLPPTLITGFNSDWTDTNPVGFPGPRVNAQYGHPVVLRFDNQLAVNNTGLSRNDFGSPEWGFLTHLHNSHTAPESDGQPHYRANQAFTQAKFGGSATMTGNYHIGGYLPNDWVDNLYLNYPAGGDDREKQGLFWFHDHFHNHTGANVYKGMVGLFPMYDPGSPSLGISDNGDERFGLRLPGVRTDNTDGSFDVDYDIPLAFYDVSLDDGNTIHQDFHAPAYPNVAAGVTHPEFWGQSFFKHFPNHGFVGDIFTVNGKAFPVLHVKRRQYRFRTLDASVSRIYEYSFMSSTGGPKAAKDLTGPTGLPLTGTELQGQYRLPDGQQCMRMLQVENGGGLLPNPIMRDKIEIWPAMRRGFLIDFAHYQDGSPTQPGDVVYLVNTAKMPDGRMPVAGTFAPADPAYKVPMIKIIIDGDPVVDNSLPIAQLLQNGQAAAAAKQASLRKQPKLILADGNSYEVSDVIDSKGNPIAPLQDMINNRREFTLQRGGVTTLPLPNEPNDNEWSINGHSFDQTINVLDQMGRPTTPTQGRPEIWTIINGGGGWVHPMHMHMEEHKILFRNGKAAATWQADAIATDSRHADDTGKDDVALMDPAESVMFYRNFRTFKGKYVAHCHNLAHEDHAMMFGWEII